MRRDGYHADRYGATGCDAASICFHDPAAARHPQRAYHLKDWTPTAVALAAGVVLFREAGLPIQCSVRVGEYHDSITLMQTAQQLTRLPGVVDAAVVMATAANKALLHEAGLWTADIEAAQANDLIVVVKADTEEALQSALALAESLLLSKRAVVGSAVGVQPRTIRSAVRNQPQSNLAVISVAGQYAAGEAWEALKSGLHVLLFSDNVSLADEIALKRYAVEHGLLVMGPGCGTAIVNGVGLGFANAVPAGPVGLVAAAGTGLQEVTCILARLRVGITQAIGTGGRDLHEEVAGITMLQGLNALQADPQTQVIVLISKPPSARIAERVLSRVRESDKPSVVCFLGQESALRQEGMVTFTRTLQEAAHCAAGIATGHVHDLGRRALERENRELAGLAARARRRLKLGQEYLRGLFSGGTLQAEALVEFRPILGEVWSNAPLEARWKLQDASRCRGHCTLDLGEEEFTVGRPHPMIDNDLRIRRLLQEAADEEVAVTLLDVVLGYGVHPDPASELGPAIRRARETARASGRQLAVVVSVTGTERDPQGLQRQVEALEGAGAIVCSCNAAAARLAAWIVSG
jgi:FdrA protein